MWEVLPAIALKCICDVCFANSRWSRQVIIYSSIVSHSNVFAIFSLQIQGGAKGFTDIVRHLNAFVMFSLQIQGKAEKLSIIVSD